MEFWNLLSLNYITIKPKSDPRFRGHAFNHYALPLPNTLIIQTPLGQCWTVCFHKSSFHSSDYKVERARSCRWHDHTAQLAQMKSGGFSSTNVDVFLYITLELLTILRLLLQLSQQLTTPVYLFAYLNPYISWREPIWLALYMLSLFSNNVSWMNVWITQSIKWLSKDLHWYKYKIE